MFGLINGGEDVLHLRAPFVSIDPNFRLSKIVGYLTALRSDDPE
jgi:hypothetical protein